MASENRGEKSQKLISLSRRLSLYEPPPHLNNPARRQHGIPKSANPKRAAVLICIFEGNDGELRVILTQRSSQLSSHSGVKIITFLSCVCFQVMLFIVIE
jgi:coenzyme A diphosphatase NUDT7